MVTPAIIIVLLVTPWLVAWAANRRAQGTWPLPLAGVVGIALVFCFTGIGHFLKTEEMSAMLPPWVPLQSALVLATGLLEIAAAAAVLVPRLRRQVGWLLIAMLLAFLPVNVYAAINRVDMGGHAWGEVYLLIRIPLQLILIGWIWWFAARTSRQTPADGSGSDDITRKP